MSLFQDHRLSPVHSLPVELLAHIFTLSVHVSVFDVDNAAEFDMADFPFDPANILTTLAISAVRFALDFTTPIHYANYTTVQPALAPSGPSYSDFMD